jgi:hypothetical protein
MLTESVDLCVEKMASTSGRRFEKSIAGTSIYYNNNQTLGHI